MQLIVQLESYQGSYHFELPSAFFPDYSRHGADVDAYAYGFSYDFTVSANSKIQNLSIP